MGSAAPLAEVVTDSARDGGAFGCAVIIPAAGCPCAQVEAIRPQLADDDCLVVVWNGPRTGGHDCAASVLHDSRSAAVWLEYPAKMGAGAARNMGVEWLSGRAEVLAFADSDDIAHDDWLAELRKGLANGRLDLAGGGLEIFSGGQRDVVLPGEDFWYRQAVYGSNCAITREAWQRLGGFSTHVGTCEDTDIAWRAVGIGLRVDIVPTAVVRYNLRHGAAEWRQRVTWGRSSVALLRAHSLPLSRHLPTLPTLISDKRSHGLAASAVIAGLGQFAGQLAGRVLDARSNMA